MRYLLFITKELKSVLIRAVLFEFILIIFLSIVLFQYNQNFTTTWNYDYQSRFVGYLYENWFFSPYLFLLPLVGIFLGIGIISSDIRDKTIAVLIMKPVSRLALIFLKFFSGMLIIILILIIPQIIVVIYSSLFDKIISKDLLYMSILSSMLLVWVFYALSFFLTLVSKISFLPLVIALLLWIDCLYVYKNSTSSFAKLLPLHLIDQRNFVFGSVISVPEVCYWLAFISMMFVSSYVIFRNKDV